MPPMAPLPPLRGTEATPFSRTGLDYLGPLFLKSAKGAKKIWICLFTCLVICAVHLEVIQDMTSEEFVLCFRRFIAQRGSPNVVISDNSMTFKAASQSIVSVWKHMTHSEEVQTYAAEKGTKWLFIVEMAPWMCGFYERLVGLVKRALRKTLGRNLLSLIQMQTLIKEIEAVLNSRPLVYVGEDINSTVTLTPRHFLSLSPNIGIPETDITECEYTPSETTGTKLLGAWKKDQKLLDKFWKTWREDYLLSLRERTQSKFKCHKSKLKCHRIQSAQSPSEGDIVLVKDEIPRGCLKIAKVISLASSRDGEINGDVSIQDDVNGDVSVNNSDDGGDMDNNIEDIIVISSDDDDDTDVSMGDGTVDISNSRTVIEALALTFYRTSRYVNGTVISSSISMERQYYMYQ